MTTTNLAPNFVIQIQLRQIKQVGNVESMRSMRYVLTLYWKNKKEEIPGRPNGTLADNIKIHVPEYASQEVQWSEDFRIIDSCHNLQGTFIVPDRIFKLTDKTLLLHCC
jgi:hypothetical protein